MSWLDGFYYDSTSHIYYYNGEEIPSVTRLIVNEDEFKYVKKEKIIEGTNRHKAIENYLKYNQIDGEYESFIEKFSETLVVLTKLFGKLLYVETPIYAEHKGVLFAGTPDIVLEDAIVDLKSSLSHQKYYALQLQGYGILVKNNYKIRSKNHIIFAEVGGVFRYKNIYNEEAKEVFEYCLKKYDCERLIKLYYQGEDYV